jgi:hypothetical protein
MYIPSFPPSDPSGGHQVVRVVERLMTRVRTFWKQVGGPRLRGGRCLNGGI